MATEAQLLGEAIVTAQRALIEVQNAITEAEASGDFAQLLEATEGLVLIELVLSGSPGCNDDTNRDTVVRAAWRDVEERVG